MNQQQRKERNERIAAGFGLVAAIAFLLLLTRHLIGEAPVPEQRGAWMALGVSIIIGFAVFTPWLLRLEPSESGSGGGWVLMVTGIALTINYVVDRLPIWVRGAVMGVGVTFLLSVLISGLIRPKRPQAESSRK